MRRPPDGLYMTALEWAEKFSGNKKSLKDYYKIIYPSETRELRPPRGIDLSCWNTQCKFEAAFITTVPNGRLWGEHGSVITPDNQIIWELSISDGGPEGGPKGHPIFYQKDLQEPMDFGSEIVGTVAMRGQNNYFHWFFDVLPRFHILKKSGYEIDRYVVNTESYFQDTQLRTLDWLGIPKDRIIHIRQQSFHLKAGKLLIPSVPHSAGYPKWVYDYIRKLASKFQEKIKPSSEYKRIYLSREDTGIRRVQNEDKVMEYLRKFGFKKVVLTSLSLEERIRIFSSAKIIVSPHGAGLVHLAFCEKGTKVIEFAVPNYDFNGFWKIGNYAGLDYYCMVSDIAHPPKQYIHHNDLIVDVHKLSKLLEEIGI